ncbi:MAG: hypothetical protein OSB57_03210 [Planctomycetota bacterium]|nr:hypothetical protein [Planctomycetota bacterium]
MKRPISSIVIVSALLLAGCSSKERIEARASGSTLAAVNDKASQIYLHTGNIPTADLDKMSTSGEAHYEQLFFHARMNNHLAQPLGNVTVRLIISSAKGQVCADNIFVRELLAAPHSDFQVTIKMERHPRSRQTWAWSLVDGSKGEDPR